MPLTEENDRIYHLPLVPTATGTAQREGIARIHPLGSELSHWDFVLANYVGLLGVHQTPSRRPSKNSSNPVIKALLQDRIAHPIEDRFDRDKTCQAI